MDGRLRRFASGLAIVLALMMPFGALAESAHERAKGWFAAGEFDKAATLFADPAWRGAALYRAGRYRMAVEAFREAGDAKSLYNLGNAHARLGEYGEAVKAFDQALAADPSLGDAAANKALMLELMAALPDPQPSGAEAGTPVRDSDADMHRATDDAADLDTPSYGREGREGTSPSMEASRQPGSAIPDDLGALPKQKTPLGKDVVPGLAADTEGEGGSGQAPPQGAPPLILGERKPMDLETRQASLEWLAAIHDDTERFLRLRLMHELARRQAEGTAVLPGRDPW